MIFYGPRDPTKLPAAPRVGRNWTPRLVGILYDPLSIAFVDATGIGSTKICERRENIRAMDCSTDSWSKYRTVSDERTNTRVASAFGSRNLGRPEI